MNFDETKKMIRDELSTIRHRAWAFTGMLTITLISYLIISVFFKDTLNIADVIIALTLQMAVMAIWFPEGEAKGECTTVFISNRKTYNEKAETIITRGRIESLGEYCEYEFLERCKNFKQSVLTRLGLTVQNYKDTETLNKEQVKAISAMEKKVLQIKPNNERTIMCGVEIDDTEAVGNSADRAKKLAFINQFVVSLVFSILLGYIGYTTHSIGFEDIIRALFYICLIAYRLIAAYRQGYENITIRKNKFYVDLINFINCFWEWEKNKKREVENGTINDASDNMGE
jgi:hypothetical protein